MSGKACVLRMTGISKAFPGVLAVDNVDLDVNEGEVLALVGENGAGKSTLIKILSGAHSADGGKIYLSGGEIKNYTPENAHKFGISVMYQELNNINDISIAENIFLGRLPQPGFFRFVSYKTLYREAKILLDRVGLHHGPSIKLNALTVAEKQLVEIAKAISAKAKVIVMDEPTSALNEEEIKILFQIVKSLVAEGTAVIYISHRLDEVFEISNRVMVMRDGKKVGVLDTAKTTKKELVEMMVGRSIEDMYPVKPRELGDIVLEVSNLNTKRIKDVSLSVRAGEIVGIYGLMGCGRTELLETIFSAKQKTSGTISANGKPVHAISPFKALKAGIAYLPSDRKLDGLILHHSVKQNVSLASIDKLRKRLFLDLKKEKAQVGEWVRRLNVKTPGLKAAVESLSGGNQQKVVFSKWMMTDPRVLILNEPTRGIDVGAKVEIYKLIEEFCRKGLGILIVSSELPEIMAICDRIYTMFAGTMTGELKKHEFTQEKILCGAIGEAI